jgi:hypothetical protein
MAGRRNLYADFPEGVREEFLRDAEAGVEQ